MSAPTEPSVERRFRRLSPLTPLVRSAILVVAALASTWDDLLRGDLGPLAWMFLAVLVAGAVYGAASWLRTTYWIEADELRVDTGVLSRQSRRIRVDRLQGIDIVQPFVARLFGLAELKMDVAGGSAREGSLAFLTLRDAQALRETLLAQREAVRGTVPGGPHPTVGPAPATAPAAGDRLVARLDLSTLLLSLLLSPETVLFLLAAVAWVVAMSTLGWFGGVAAALPVLGGLLLTQFRKLSAYYGFVVTTSTRGLQIRRGLFELSAQTVTLSKVQGVVMSEPLMWRRMGWARLDVAVAGQVEVDGGGGPSASTVMPVAPRAEVLLMARLLLEASGSPDADAVELVGAPARARWAAPVSWRHLSFGIGEDVVVSREGLLIRRTHVVPHARVQSLNLHQGPWQRRLGLADLRVDSPPGPVRVRGRHRDAYEARDLMARERVLAEAARGSFVRPG
ncbi:MAG TPA: PH domain-containing protein [Nocardioidaceae bacterium]|nr:PH domain-containing protein [Nocardioidaceae bacterium]